MYWNRKLDSVLQNVKLGIIYKAVQIIDLV